MCIVKRDFDSTGGSGQPSMAWQLRGVYATGQPLRWIAPSAVGDTGSSLGGWGRG